MRNHLVVAGLLAALGMVSPAIPYVPDTRPTSRKRLETGWPRFRRDREQQKEIEAHNRQIETKKRERLERRAAKRQAGMEVQA